MVNVSKVIIIEFTYIHTHTHTLTHIYIYKSIFVFPKTIIKLQQVNSSNVVIENTT